MNNINDTIIKANLTKLNIEKLWKLMIDKLNNISTNKYILLLGLGNPYFYDLACRYFKKELIYIIEDKSSKFLYLGRSDIQNIKFINLKNITEDTFNNMEFDKIIMNPPFGKNLHLKILEKAIEHLTDDGTCVNLSPIRWLQDPLINFNLGKEFNEYKKTICNYISNIEIIDYMQSNKIFGISHGNLGLYTCNKSKFNYYDCTKLSKINILTKSILQKLYTKKNIYYRTKDFCIDKTELDKNIDKFLNKLDKKYEYFILLSRANGSMDARWQSGIMTEYDILNKFELKTVLKKIPGRKKIVGFSKNEFTCAKSLLKLLNKNCFRFILAITQDSQNIMERSYYFFPDIDYSKINNEKDFYEYFGITEEEQQLIKETMEKYK